MSKIIKAEFTVPKFIFGETPIKDGTFHDRRTWFYCPSALSLIEFIPLDNFSDFNNNSENYFVFIDAEGDEEHWSVEWVQNHCTVVGMMEEELMSEAITVFKRYLMQVDKYE